MERIEKGVMVMKNGKAWGIEYEDGHSTAYGWVHPTIAPIRDPKYCKKTTDVTYRGSPYIEELETAQLVMVERKTTVRLI